MSEREPALLGADGPEPDERAGAVTREQHEADTRPTGAAMSEPEPAPESEPSREPEPVATAPEPEPSREPEPVATAPEPEPSREPEPIATAPEPAAPVRPSRRDAPAVYVVGLWKRLAAAAVDLAIVIPASLLITLIVSKVASVRLPPSNLKLLDLDMWIDLVLAADPALVMGMVLMLAIGMTYLLVFQIVVGRTPGMRLLKIKIIDVYGARPSPARCVARCAGYLASAATLCLGFLWMGFDSEKRGLQDWIAGTYVIRA